MRTLKPGFAGLLAAGLAPLCLAQAIDPSAVHATLRAPLHLSLAMKAATGASPLREGCVQAEVVQGDRLLTADDLDVSIGAPSRGGWQTVHLSHPAAVTEPLLNLRLSLVCGPPFEREFTVLADPPSRTERNTSLAAASPRRLAAPAVAPADARPQIRQEQVGSAPPSTLAQMPPLRPPGPAVHTPPLEPTAAAPSVPVMNALAIDDIRRLSDEQQRMLLALSRLQSQMDHPRGAWREWTQPALVVSAAVVLTVLLLRAGLQWSAARRPRTAMALDIAWPAARAPTHAAPDAPRPKLPEPAPTAPPGTSTGEPVGSAVYRKRSEQYPHGNFGQPDLDNEPPVEVLRRVESLTAEGMQGAAMALLEHHLHQHPGHNPWLLLGLLDVYGDLGQPWNQERVAAQLEVLYNVHIPDLNTAHVEGHDLEQHTEALSCIVQAWPTKDRCDALASILLRTNEHAELDLAAFREALLLHAIARQLEPPDAGPLPFEPLIDWPDNA